MAKGGSKKNKNTQPKPPRENYIFVVNADAWCYESGKWRWEIVDAWFETMCKGEGSGMQPEQYFYQKTHGFLIVKLDKDTSKNVSHLFGKHYFRRFLPNRAPDDATYATIYPYNYAKWGDPAKQQWSEEYRMPGRRNVPLREPYPIPEPTTELPAVDAIKWIRQVDDGTYQRLAERYALANPDWRHDGPSSASAAVTGTDADSAEALLAPLIPKTTKPGGVTPGKKEEDADVKPSLIVKREEDRKFKVDPEDVKLPTELMHGSIGHVKSEHPDLRVKMDEDGIDRKPSEFPPDLPPELMHGSVYSDPQNAARIKLEQGGAVQVKPEAPEDNSQDASAKYHQPGVNVKREDNLRASERIKEEEAGYSSGSYKRVKREHLL